MNRNHLTWLTDDPHRPARGLDPEPFVSTSVLVAAGLPVSLSPWQYQLYQWAYEQARAVVQPSWLERDPLGHRN